MNKDEENVRVDKAVSVTVRDTRGKAYKLELVDGGVKITPPMQIRVAPIVLADLRRALSELEAAAGT